MKCGKSPCERQTGHINWSKTSLRMNSDNWVTGINTNNHIIQLLQNSDIYNQLAYSKEKNQILYTACSRISKNAWRLF